VARSQRCQESRSLQGASCRLGRRVCLLKGCQQTFWALHPLARYCSSACRAAADLWRRRTANRRYRSSEQGKCRRRAQACRYRKRVRERECAVPSNSLAAGEGYPHLQDDTDSCCQRPGCYQAFTKTARSPLQKFCSAPCRQALRRVLIRERWWSRRLLRARRSGWRGDDSW
jgi:hypothetical protein